MIKLKRTISILISAIMLFSVFAIAPITASAYDIAKPQNFRVTSIDLEEGDKWSVDLAWSPAPKERYSYQIVWETSSSTDWRSDTGSSPSDWWCNDNNTGDYTYTFHSLTYGKTYYFFVRWVANEYPKSSARVDFGHAGDGLPTTVPKSDYSMIKFDWKMGDNDTSSPSVKVKTKSIKASDLKKSNKTIKPLTIKNASNVKVTKVKSGTTKKIYKKITVKKKTGAITFKKGKYKKGTYKIKLKIKCDSKTFNKTVKVKIK